MSSPQLRKGLPQYVRFQNSWYCKPIEAVEQMVELPMIWDASECDVLTGLLMEIPFNEIKIVIATSMF